MNSSMTNILQLCACQSVYNTNLQKKLRNSNGFECKYNMDAFYIDKELRKEAFKRYEEDYFKLGYWCKIKCYISVYKKLSALLKRGNYVKSRDIVNIQFVGKNNLLFLPLLKRHFKRIVASFWGSDLLVTNKKTLRLLNVLLNKCDYISLETNEEKRIFGEVFKNKYEKKIREVRFGIDALDLIDNVTDDDIKLFMLKHAIDPEKKVIVVGYNRTYNQQHLQVVESIVNNKKLDLSTVQIVIPWTYGSDSSKEYQTNIVEALNGRVDFIFLENFLTDFEVAVLRRITYIMIQVQMTDSLSSSMLETLYARGMVITGKWLPYSDLYSMGIKMNAIENVNDVGDELYDLLLKPWDNETTNNNRCLIEQYSSWEANISKWLELYN